MNVPNWKQRLTAEMKRDKKKTALLAILCIVAGIVIGRVIIKQFSPSKANAAGKSSAATAAPSDSASKIISPPAESSDDQGDNSKKLREYIARLDTKVSRDIFLPDESVFPPRVEKKIEPPSVKLENEGPSEEEKLEARKKIVLAQAQALTLQSTIVSATPTAMINDRVLRKGDTISGFEVVEITPRTCSLMKDEITVILGMKGQSIDNSPQEANDGD